MLDTAPIAKELLLLGGGHAHVTVLKRFAMAPVAGLRITLINRGYATPYSGMLPGLIAGHYTFDETHIDLGRLARYCRARFICDDAIGIDTERKHLLFRDRPPVRYDVLSIDTGSAPDLSTIPGALEHAVPVKPISAFLERWNALCARASGTDAPLNIAVAGAGAGGIELILAAQYRLQSLRRSAGIGAPMSFHLYSASGEILPAFNSKVRSIFSHLLAERRITVSCGVKVSSINQNGLELDNGETHYADEVLLVTDAGAPGWFGAGGLACDDGGFIRVADTLQSLSHPDIFAAGDVAASVNHPRPKAGVFAVRQGSPLARNLRNMLTGKSLIPFVPQKQFLSLVSTGGRHAVAARNRFGISGDWVWRWKDWIDRRFMSKFNDLPPMDPGSIPKPVAHIELAEGGGPETMRCGGCGAKVGADILGEALRGLAPIDHADVIAGLDAPDDAAIVRNAGRNALVHTVDSFRALVDDPYAFGQIAANHALSDIFAMGAKPRTALAIATLPYADPAVTAGDLHQMMAGAISVLNEAGAALVGGHTSEGAELTLGFAINGAIDESDIMRKGGLRPGDRIIVTKPLGIGALFAADMQARAKSQWIEAAIASMLQSNGPAAQTILAAGSQACTDITGFGLAGHLGELTQSSGVCISIAADALPLLEGASSVMAEGIFSSLHDQNVRSAQRYFDPTQADALKRHPVLFDPQTSGGLAAGVEAGKAPELVAHLRRNGYPEACIIGEAAVRDGGAWLKLHDAKP